jgi:hypothetical protein
VKVSERALHRLNEAIMSGPGFAMLCCQMAQAIELNGAAGASFTLDYQDPQDPVDQYTLIPVITVSLRPATLKD